MKVVRRCCVATLCLLAGHRPTLAQTSAPANFVSVVIAEFTPGISAPPANFDRYRLLPCEFLNADTRATAMSTTPDPETKTSAPRACQCLLDG